MAGLLGSLPVATIFHTEVEQNLPHLSADDCRLMKPEACGATAENPSIPLLLIVNESTVGFSAQGQL